MILVMCVFIAKYLPLLLFGIGLFPLQLAIFLFYKLCRCSLAKLHLHFKVVFNLNAVKNKKNKKDLLPIKVKLHSHQIKCCRNAAFSNSFSFRPICFRSDSYSYSSHPKRKADFCSKEVETSSTFGCHSLRHAATANHVFRQSNRSRYVY